MAAEQGHTDYAEFLVAMHHFSARLLAEAQLDIAEAEATYKNVYVTRQKEARQDLDEANWYWAVGRYSTLHGAC